jgi:hypothetical protein
MTASPEGCGVVAHDELCLCDVKITNPTTTTVNIPYGITNGEAIAHYGKWDGTLYHWFKLMEFSYREIHKFRLDEEESTMDKRQFATGRFKRTLPDDVYEFLVEGIRQGVQPTPLKNNIAERFGVTINKSYVTKLRQRLVARGEIKLCE